MAQKSWATVKGELLQTLHTHQSWGTEQAKVDIFLYEGLIDNAIAVVTDLHSYQSDLIHQVMDAAITHKPEWVIENACRRAEKIVDAGKAEYYHHAVNWLKKARAAYLQANRQSEWSAYRTQLMTTPARKRKLMEMLRRQDMV